MPYSTSCLQIASLAQRRDAAAGHCRVGMIGPNKSAQYRLGTTRSYPARTGARRVVRGALKPGLANLG